MQADIADKPVACGWLRGVGFVSTDLSWTFMVPTFFVNWETRSRPEGETTIPILTQAENVNEFGAVGTTGDDKLRTSPAVLSTKF